MPLKHCQLGVSITPLGSLFLQSNNKVLVQLVVYINLLTLLPKG